MKHARFIRFMAVAAIAIPHFSFAQSGFGLTWGFARTYWDGTWYKDGYAEAGTGGNSVGIRKDNPLTSNMDVSLYVNYLWQRHTTTTLIEPVIINPDNDEVISGGLLLTQTHFTFYREWEFGGNVHYFVHRGERSSIYLGGGPSVRWGHAGKREIHEPRPGNTVKAAWFGLTALAGYVSPDLGGGASAFFEPQLTFSPDPADRFQRIYPPVNLSFVMGLQW